MLGKNNVLEKFREIERGQKQKCYKFWNSGKKYRFL